MSTSLTPLADGGWDGPIVLSALVGHQITEVWWSSEDVTFVTPDGNARYEVEGDCCSHSYLHDLIGLANLMAGPVTQVEAVSLGEADLSCSCCRNGECIEQYGYRIFTMHPHWGECTTVLSFRNDSNGYYGGSLERCALDDVQPGQRLLTADVVSS